MSMGWLSQTLAVPLSGMSVTPWLNSARCSWRHPAQTSCDHPVHGGPVWLPPVLKHKEEVSQRRGWVRSFPIELRQGWGAASMAEEAPGVGSLTPPHSCRSSFSSHRSAAACYPPRPETDLGVSEPATPGLCPGGLLSSPVPHAAPNAIFPACRSVSHAALLQFSPGRDPSGALSLHAGAR